MNHREDVAIRIIQVRTIKVEIPGQGGPIKGDTPSIGCLLVYVDTDAGITGESLLFAFSPAGLAPLDAMVRLLGGEAIGRDPHSSTALWQALWQRTSFFGHEGVSIFAISAIDRACWDIVAKVAGLPLYQLLGAARDDAPAYASGLWLSMTIDELVEGAKAFVADGFRAMKMRIGMPAIEADVDRVAAVRETIGPGVDLMVDANRRFSVDHAIRLGRRLEPFELAWFEEPVALEDLAGSARVAAELDVPIATGEGAYTRYGFRAILDHKAADILMPDMGRVGGVTELLRVAHLAAAYDIPVTPHNYPQEAIQIVGAIANATFVECLPWFAPLYREPAPLVDGRMVVPRIPGNGTPFDPDAVERYRIRD